VRPRRREGRGGVGGGGSGNVRWKRAGARTRRHFWGGGAASECAGDGRGRRSRRQGHSAQMWMPTIHTYKVVDIYSKVRDTDLYILNHHICKI
jgi:hypothetical protein